MLCSFRQHCLALSILLAPHGNRVSPEDSEGVLAVDLRVPLVFLEINPSCAQWKLLLHVLEVLVAETINADQGTGLGVTDVLDCN